MITLSLNEIRDHSPCKSGWETLLKSKPGADWSEQFPLSDIIDSNGLDDALWCLRVRPEHSNLWRKYAVWCARQVEHLMTDERSKAALRLSPALAAAASAALSAATAAAWAAALEASDFAAAAAVLAAATAAVRAAALEAADFAAGAAVRAAQEKKLREILQAEEWR